MEKRALITTAIEESWFPNKKVFFLGEWCRLESRRDKWSSLDSKVLLFHWDDRNKFLQDFIYLDIIYEKYLNLLSIQLNNLHDVKYDIKYWRILIGPWLGYFIAILYDRWSNVTNFLNTNEDTNTIFFKINISEVIPNDMNHFGGLYVSDIWNHYIFSEILKKLGYKNYCYKSYNSNTLNSLKQKELNISTIIRNTISFFSYCISKIIPNTRQILFISPNIPFLDQCKISLKLGQIPLFLKPSNNVKKIKSKSSLRTWKLNSSSDSEFEKILNHFIPLQIPKVYLEGYKSLMKVALSQKLPSKTQCVVTATEHIVNDNFKAWVSIQVELGSKLCIRQHGGHYGIGKLSFQENHEILISHKYLTWGWTKIGSDNILPFGHFLRKPFFKIKTYSKNCTAVVVMNSVPRYSYWMYSCTVSAVQFNRYCEDCFEFIELLDDIISSRLIVRLNKNDFENQQFLKWKNRFPGVKIDSGSCNMNYHLNNSKIIISTYNATVFLESLAMNKPTLFFWDPYYWELRESADTFFLELEKAGIFHKSPKSAALHLNNIWTRIDDWWLSNEVQMACKSFCDKYVSKANISLLNNLKN